MTHKGYLLLFDISGYTEFLARSELDTGVGILQSLLGTLLEHVQPPLVVAELEGDAVFAYALEGGFRRGETLLEVVEELYCVFAAAREQMEHNAACDCSGCKLFPKLDLKVVAHHGSFVLGSAWRDRPAKPVGPDVVVAHRLLKNHVVEATGLRSYLLVTEACREALGLESLPDGAVPHSETYEHVGTVRGFVHDLAPVWALDRERRLARVEDRDTWVRVETEIAASPQVVWDAMSSPELKTLWRHADRVRVGEGRTGPGTTYRCYRGEVVTVERVVDWRPFRRLTLDCEWTWGARIRMTAELEPSATGTRLVVLLGKPEGPAGVRGSVLRGWYRTQTGRMERRCRRNVETLAARVRPGTADVGVPAVAAAV